MGPAALLALGMPGPAAATSEQALALQKDSVVVMQEKARACDERGQFGTKVIVLEQLRKQRPQDYRIAVDLARCYLLMGRLDQAAEAFAQAKKINGKKLEAYVGQSGAYLKAGANAQARQEFESLIAADTSSPIGYLEMGNYYEKLQRPREAEENYRQALQRMEAKPLSNPYKENDALFGLGRNLLLQARPAEAEAVYRRGLEKSGRDLYWRANFLNTLGDLFAAEGKSVKAERLYKEIFAACEPGAGCRAEAWTGAAFKLGGLYAAQGRIPEAKAIAARLGKVYDGVAIKDANVSEFGNLAELFLKIGDSAKAETLLRRIIAARADLPSDMPGAQAQKILAQVRLAQGRRAEAAELVLKATAVFTSHGDKDSEAEARSGLLLICKEAGKGPEAATACQQALGLADDAESLRRMGEHFRSVGDAAGLAEVEKKLAGLKTDRPAALLVLGGLLRSEGKNAEASVALEQALALKPDDPEVERALADIYIDQSQYEKAAAILQKAFKQMPQDYKLAIGLGHTYSALGQWDRAQEAFDQAKRINSRDPEAYSGQGEADFKAGDLARAEQEFKSLVALDTASPIGYSFLGRIYDKLQRPQEAQRFYKQGLAACESWPGCHLQDWADTATSLGNLYVAQNRRPEAAALAERLAKRSEGAAISDVNAGWFITFAELLLKVGDSAKAEEFASRIMAARGSLQSDMYMGRAEMILADVRRAQGRWAEVESLYLRASEFFKSHGEKVLAENALEGLSIAYDIEGKEDEAKAAAEQARGARSGKP